MARVNLVKSGPVPRTPSADCVGSVTGDEHGPAVEGGGGHPTGPGPGPEQGRAPRPEQASERGPRSRQGTERGPGPGQGTGTGTGTGTGAEPWPDTGPGTAADTGPDTGAGAGAGGGAGTGPEAGTATGPGPGPDPVARDRAGRSPSAVAFDVLYLHTARRLTRQLYVLTGDRPLARESVEYGFQEAWLRWPEIAVDPDPESWVRTAACEYALSPWHRLIRRHRGRLGGFSRRGGRRAETDEATRSAPRVADRPLFQALQKLTGRQRHSVLLYDGVGLDLPDTAAETQATTPAAAARLENAHALLAGTVPALAGADPRRPEFTRKLGHLLREAATSYDVRPAPPSLVRTDGERRATRTSRYTGVLAAALALGMLASVTVGYIRAELRQAAPRPPVTGEEPERETSAEPPWRVPGQDPPAVPLLPQRIWNTPEVPRGQAVPDGPGAGPSSDRLGRADAAGRSRH